VFGLGDDRFVRTVAVPKNGVSFPKR
jgi:hypothetical protein